MLIVKNKFGKGVIKLLMTLNSFKRYFAILTWGNAFVITRTKPVNELIKIKIKENNVLTLKFKYHSSLNILNEYIAEIEKHNHNDKKLFLNIWSSEQKTELIKQTVLELSEQTNLTIKELLETKIFNEKYGNNYRYFITLYLNPDITKVKEDERQFSEITLKYSLKPDNKKKEMRHKSKFNISKSEAQKLCSMISYWNI